jgi:hypothetical protein
MNIDLLKLDFGGDGWSGRTGLSGSYEDVVGALFQAKEDEERQLSVATVMGWLHELVDTYPSVPSGRIVPSDPEWADRFEGGFQGWEPSPPSRPYYTPPLPFDFLLPCEQNASPLEALKPWWDMLAIAEAEAKEKNATYSGKRMGFGTFQAENSRWMSGELYSLGAWSQLTVLPDSLEARVRFDATSARIAQPGLVGSLVPGYGAVKSLTSTLSERTNSLFAGCCINFAFISALTYHMTFNLHAPLLAFAMKEKVKAHGYGENTDFEIGIEFSDGWRPYRVCLKSEYLPYDEEEASLRFFGLVTRAVAEARLQKSHLSESERESLAAVAASEPSVTDSRLSNTLRRDLRVEFAGHRPISVELPS